MNIPAKQSHHSTMKKTHSAAKIRRERARISDVPVKRKAPAQRFTPTVTMGLTSDQVKTRRREGYANTPVSPPSKTTAEIIKTNVFTYFNLIFAILAALLIISGSFRDLTFLPIIIANTLIGIIQETRSKKVLDKLTVLHAPKAHVIRDGRGYEISADDLVLDDIVVFGAGNQIPADAVVVSGEVQANESLITGESDEITKSAGSSLLSGSFIVSGRCFARLERVGEDSYISKLTLEAKQVKEGEQSEMMRSLNRLVKTVGFVIIPIGIILFSESYFYSELGFQDSVKSTVAALIGMIPEGLYLLASVALVVSVMRLAQKKVLVHELSCIETLARVDVLCVDKTGTITETSMEVDGIVCIDESYEGDTLPLEKLIGDFSASMETDNITMQALQKYFRQSNGRRALSITSFSAANKYSSATFEDAAYVLGAPEFVLKSDYSQYRELIETYSADGHRVLVFASYDGAIDGGPLAAPAKPLCLVLLSNPIRKEAPDTFAYFEKQGVEIKVISGDNPITVSAIAKKAGISHAEEYVDASTLTSPALIEEAMQRCTVFGRVTPNQKRQFVQALKKTGHTVAMTGDGVNDVLALKDADCSIAMASGSEAASHASQLVLLESDFSRMPSVVMEGRRVVNNIELSSSLFLVKNIFSFLMSLFSMIFLVSYPLTPSQVSMISMFTIGIPAFFLALEPNQSLIRGRFLPNVLLRALPAGLTDFVVVGALVIFGNVFEVDAADISTAATLLLAIVGLMILYKISKPMNKLRWGVWWAMVGGLLISIIFFNGLFGITAVSLKGALLLTAFSIMTEPIFRFLCLLVEKGEEGVQFLMKRWRRG